MKYFIQQKKALGIILLTQVLLVATHLGEFWPFSIYPMFSQAGRTWTRSLVCDVSNTPDNQLWVTRNNVDNLPGEIFAIDEVGINQNDVANFIQKVDGWSDENISFIKGYFESELDNRKLLLYEVKGSLVGNDVNLNYYPLIYMNESKAVLNPNYKK